ncbi:hypothetical protein [Paraburkholderia sp. JHI869]|uniref:hypothetical protein n=1 Tax=Paraburkholderia sp. JHI869 TaxID=3112959 RepID=UPI0031712B63
MVTVAVAAQDAREFRELFVDWSRGQGAHVVFEPPESAGFDGAVNFSLVPEEFLEVLGAAGLRYTRLST